MTGGARVTDQAVRPAAPLLPGGARRTAVIALIACAAVLTAGAILDAGRSRAGPLDRGIDNWIIARLRTHQHGAFQITNLGNPTPMIALTIIIVLACLTVRRVNGAVLTVAAVLVANFLTEVVLKPIVHETIGHPGVLSYPSGHTTSVFTLVAVVAVLLVAPPRPRMPAWLRLIVVLLAVAVGVTVAICLIAIQFHYFTDTVGGVCVATGTVLGIALLLDGNRPRAFLGRWKFRSDGQA
jgi:membrane-associated phospholipid phosphatase